MYPNEIVKVTHKYRGDWWKSYTRQGETCLPPFRHVGSITPCLQLLAHAASHRHTRTDHHICRLDKETPAHRSSFKTLKQTAGADPGLEFFSTFEAGKRGNDKGDTDRRTKCPVPPTSRAVVAVVLCIAMRPYQFIGVQSEAKLCAGKSSVKCAVETKEGGCVFNILKRGEGGERVAEVSHRSAMQETAAFLAEPRSAERSLCALRSFMLCLITVYRHGGGNGYLQYCDRAQTQWAACHVALLFKTEKFDTVSLSKCRVQLVHYPWSASHIHNIAADRTRSDECCTVELSSTSAVRSPPIKRWSPQPADIGHEVTANQEVEPTARRASHSPQTSVMRSPPIKRWSLQPAEHVDIGHEVTANQEVEPTARKACRHRPSPPIKRWSPQPADIGHEVTANQEVEPTARRALIANDVFTGNCNRLKDIGKSVGIMGILGMFASWPAAGPDAALIMWDECTMSHRAHVEAVDRTSKDLRSSTAIMGGVTFVFAGDFRQTLPVVTKGMRADIIKAFLKSSPLWSSIQHLNLRTNMRAYLGGDTHKDFPQQLLASKRQRVSDTRARESSAERLQRLASQNELHVFAGNIVPLADEALLCPELELHETWPSDVPTAPRVLAARLPICLRLGRRAPADISDGPAAYKLLQKHSAHSGKNATNNTETNNVFSARQHAATSHFAGGNRCASKVKKRGSDTGDITRTPSASSLLRARPRWRVLCPVGVQEPPSRVRNTFAWTPSYMAPACLRCLKRVKRVCRRCSSLVLSGLVRPLFSSPRAPGGGASHHAVAPRHELPTSPPRARELRVSRVYPPPPPSVPSTDSAFAKGKTHPGKRARLNSVPTRTAALCAVACDTWDEAVREGFGGRDPIRGYLIRIASGVTPLPTRPALHSLPHWKVEERRRQTDNRKTRESTKTTRPTGHANVFRPSTPDKNKSRLEMAAGGTGYAGGKGRVGIEYCVLWEGLTRTTDCRGLSSRRGGGGTYSPIQSAKAPSITTSHSLPLQYRKQQARTWTHSAGCRVLIHFEFGFFP
ncbi:hypothetical protein PR048_025068 [Dryococelus australis]|uniref:ATP-dependent DNA helicase n=1 Tax=Dryococelus australis TaxID=614101 RepID=A0ABQ9GQE0_9NEOP|nr:hypothetical protein PR048_025068 [Dryococelus australis]